MSEREYKLIVVRADGRVQETRMSGWHAESSCDRLIHEAINRSGTLFAVLFDGPGSIRRSWPKPAPLPAIETLLVKSSV